MTPDIQELKRLAEAARDRPLNSYGEPSIEASYFYRAASPSTILALIEAVKRQGEALEPFAIEADKWNANTPDAERYDMGETRDEGTAWSAFTVGDLRRARAAFKETTGG